MHHPTAIDLNFFLAKGITIFTTQVVVAKEAATAAAAEWYEIIC